MESRKIVLKNLFIGQQQRNRHREETYDTGRGQESMRLSSLLQMLLCLCQSPRNLHFDNFPDLRKHHTHSTEKTNVLLTFSHDQKYCSHELSAFSVFLAASVSKPSDSNKLDTKQLHGSNSFQETVNDIKFAKYMYNLTLKLFNTKHSLHKAWIIKPNDRNTAQRHLLELCSKPGL